MEKKTFPVEGFVSVKDFLAKVGDVDAVEHVLTHNKIARRWAITSARRRVTEALRTSRFPRSLKLQHVRFVETDSGNWNHATAYYDVIFSGSKSMIEKLEQAFKSPEAT